MTYLGFGVVAQRRADDLLIENSMNGIMTVVKLTNVPLYSPCRTVGHVVNIYRRDDDGEFVVEWAR